MSTEASPTRYFQLQRANRLMAGISFEPFDIIAGSLWGIHKTNDPGELAGLDEAMKDPKNGLSEITADEYGRMAQKKTQNSRTLTELRPKLPPAAVPPLPAKSAPVAASEPAAGAPMKGDGKVVVIENPPPKLDEASPESGTVPVAKVEDALSLGEVTPPPTAPERNSRKGKAKPAEPAE